MIDHPIENPTPVAPDCRLEFVDILRGFALFGVLAANMVAFSGYDGNSAAYADFWDKAILIGIQFFIRAKFYTLFSFLFGWGVSVQFLNAAKKERAFVPVFARRMAILLIFGMIHGMLIWTGDILTLYAVLGFLLLLFLNRSERALLITAVFLLIFAAALNLPGDLIDSFRTGYEELTAFMRRGDLPQGIYATGDYWTITQKRMQDYWAAQSWFIYYIGGTFSMFLLGLYVGKRQIFQHVEDHLPLLRRTAVISLIIGIIFNATFVYNTLHPDWVDPRYGRFVGVGSRTIGAPAFMLFYASGIALLTRRQSWLERLRPLGNLGRMALTNYLAQSVIFTLIFYGYGLGLYGQTDPSFGFLLTVAVYAAQVRLSGWWLRAHQFGPMEWLWRTLTYGRRQPWRHGQTYDNMRPNRFIAAIRGLNPVLTLGIVWIVLMLWTGGLLYWSRNLGVGGGVAFELAAQPTAVSSPTPDAAANDPDAPAAIATPVVEPVAYQPGTIARSGDIDALAETFDVDRAFAQIETLTGEPYNGRRAASSGGIAAADYLAEQFAAFGLQPAGEDGTFFQTFPVSYTNLAASPQLVVTAGNRTADYALYEDFSPIIRDFAGDGIGSGDVVWMNNCSHDDFGLLDANDKIVLCKSGLGRSAIQEASRQAVEHGAIGLLLATTPDERSSDMGDRYTHPWIPEPIPALRVYPAVVDDLFNGSGTTITDALTLDAPMPLQTSAELIVETLGNNACPTISQSPNLSFPCAARNVLAVLPGRDPAFADEIIIIGAHFDHLGESPDGTMWTGANDNASGTAVLLEIARSWQEQGVVPRRTILFAAWDAEELGLLGSSHYVNNSQYPPENIVAMIQLDMVGAGGDILGLDGDPAFANEIAATAATMGISTTLSAIGRSDHAPFLAVGTPAVNFIWLDEAGEFPVHYHRPADTLDVIDLEKLEAVGQLAATIALNLAESEPAILAMLHERSTAVTANDLSTFLNSSTEKETAVDQLWFADLQTLTPLTVTIAADDLRIIGDTANSSVTIAAAVPAEDADGTQTITAVFNAQFQQDEEGWRWDGSHLTDFTADGVTIAYPPADELEAAALATATRTEYAAIADALGTPADAPLRIELLPNNAALRAVSGLSLPEGASSWIAPGVCRTTEETCTTLTQLALANAGIVEADDPLLWNGLPLVWASEADRAGKQPLYLPVLQAALATDNPIPPDVAAWAATDYAVQQVGWEGLLDWQQTDEWQADWARRLTAVQSDLDALMEQRTAAILAQNEAALLQTAVPDLAAAQRRWLTDLEMRPLDNFKQTAVPLAFLEDGSVLARVIMEYQLTGRGPSTAEMDIQFMPDGDDLLWAGKRLHELDGETAVIAYPDQYEETAVDLQAKADAWIPELAALFNVSPSLPIRIELYDGDDDFRAAIALPYPPATNWTETGQAIKLHAEASDNALVNQLTRQLLHQAGITDEWLLSGVGAYVSRAFDDGATQMALAAQWPELLTAVGEDRLLPLAAIPPAIELSQEDAALAQAQSWDAVRYFVHTYGWDLERLTSAEWSQGIDEFQQEWEASLAQGHIQPQWVEAVGAFDAAGAMETIEFLTSEEMAGRLAGTMGAETAATYIADEFHAAGLQPAGENGSFFQTVPITFSDAIAPLQVELLLPSGETVALVYRDEFLPVHPTIGGEPVTGDLFFMQKDASYDGIDFEGGVVVRAPSLPLEQEINQAIEHGASALVLAGIKREDIDLYGKRPYALLPTAEIPVLELTLGGYDSLLAAFDLNRNMVKKLLPVQPLDGEATVHFAVSPPQKTTTTNVLAVLPGSDPDLGQEIIIVGAHYDHVGDDPDGRRYNGINDDASGVATMLEIARLWQEIGYQPQRTILFAAWGGQELGNLGSGFYAENPTRPLTDTIALIQLDGVGGGDGFALGAQGDAARDSLLLSGLETAALLLDNKLVITPPKSPSDHESFSDLGFPTLLISWRLARENNLADEVDYAVSVDNLRVSGETAVLLLMALGQ